MPQNTPKKVRNFHVVGGGCFGRQYVRWLLRARSLGMVEFEKIIAIDRDPNCLLLREGPSDESLRILQKDWVDYLADDLLSDIKNSSFQKDHWVPAPLSPHILLLGFLRAAGKVLKEVQFKPLTFQEDVKTPIQISLNAGTYAVSFAEWQCPINCIEPSQCPAIHAPRTWDMKTALDKYFGEQNEFRSSHVLQCQHLVHGVGTIPLSTIFSEFEDMLERLSSVERIKKIAVATVSGCHGLIGAAEVLRPSS